MITINISEIIKFNSDIITDINIPIPVSRSLI